ncbi:hypothetical protein [Anaerovibrio sp. JC8]|uniref:hypothetical protein n=1 Tax=Anaerovibrio sp. JC8 TaxID=1240085 RepID=UPI000A10A806|nr:hypothetical protein [Anaerovibrio sp. JC8]
MFYNQYPYSIFNQNSLSLHNELQTEKDAKQHHLEQQKYILEMRKAIADFCRAARKITEDYQQQSMNACIEEILIQAKQDGYGGSK